MKTDDDILNWFNDLTAKVAQGYSYSWSDEKDRLLKLVKKTTSQARQECGLEQTEKIMIAFEKGKKAERKECESGKYCVKLVQQGQQAERKRIFDVLQQYKNEDSSFILIKIKEALKTRLGQKEVEK